MAVTLSVTDASTGAAATLSPYLGAAAHVYIAPADLDDKALYPLTCRRRDPNPGRTTRLG